MKEQKQLIYIDPKIPDTLRERLTLFIKKQLNLSEIEFDDTHNILIDYLYDGLLADLIIPLDIRVWQYYYDKTKNFSLRYEVPVSGECISLTDEDLNIKISSLFLFPTIIQDGLFYYKREVLEKVKELYKKLAADIQEKYGTEPKDSEPSFEKQEQGSNFYLSVKEVFAKQLKDALKRLEHKVPLTSKDIYTHLGWKRQTFENRFNKYFIFDKDKRLIIDKKTGTPISP